MLSLAAAKLTKAKHQSPGTKHHTGRDSNSYRESNRVSGRESNSMSDRESNRGRGTESNIISGKDLNHDISHTRSDNIQ